MNAAKQTLQAKKVKSKFVREQCITVADDFCCMDAVDTVYGDF